MKYLLKEFKHLLVEESHFPKDELRDYYLVPAKTLLASNPDIANNVLDHQTPLMMVIQSIVKKNNHIIRETHLNTLAWEIIDLTNEMMINYQNKEGNTAIHLTAYMECFSVGLLDLMKEKGANFSIVNKKGETPMMLVSSGDSLDDLKFIHAYTNENMLNHHDNVTGATALIRAVKAKKTSNAFFLLEQGASVLEKDQQGFNALDYANDKKSDELHALLSLFVEKEKTEKAIKKLSSLKDN